MGRESSTPCIGYKIILYVLLMICARHSQNAVTVINQGNFGISAAEIRVNGGIVTNCIQTSAMANPGMTVSIQDGIGHSRGEESEFKRKIHVSSITKGNGGKRIQVTKLIDCSSSSTDSTVEYSSDEQQGSCCMCPCIKRKPSRSRRERH